MQDLAANKQHTSSKRSIDPILRLENTLQAEGVEISGNITSEFSEILTIGAIRFVAKLVRQFSDQRVSLLRRRAKVQAEINEGKFPNFLSETSHIRSSSWKIDSVPPDLQDRRVEITGPSGDAKMVINALNSGANVYMADFEDAQSPTWENTIQGQINLRDAIRGTIIYRSPEGKTYNLNRKTATLMVRPRGWHLHEKHVLIDGEPISGSLFDFGLFFYHNAIPLLNKGTRPYFYLPKMESHLEARLWNEVFLFAQSELGIYPGAIKATVLIETILAAFEMEEILFELRDHSAGLNCGRWDYIFSFIKKFHRDPRFVLPNRALVTMDKGFLASYVKLLIQTCHKRGAHAMGGMAAQIPIKNNEDANTKAIEKVRTDKIREVTEGHDGTWVAHPGLVCVAKKVFDEGMPGPNQFHALREDVKITAADLLQIANGEISEAGLRMNIDVGLQYLEAWLRGSGAVPLYNLMEDAATAEISRAQVWQWIHHHVELTDGRKVTAELVHHIIKEELQKIRTKVGDDHFHSGQYLLASELFKQIVIKEEFSDFLTLPAYEYL